jgi:uncharacterized coiled-coil protein SlyX
MEQPQRLHGQEELLTKMDDIDIQQSKKIEDIDVKIEILTTSLTSLQSQIIQLLEFLSKNNSIS